jgi:ABC-type dipeptide/oligopeptide/nickel transport system permease component
VARYVLVRLVGIVGVLIAVSIITFGMMHAVPGGPFDVYAEQQIPLPEHIKANLNAKYHLDEPIYVQYLSYMGSALRGDFGVSFRYGEPVSDFIQRSWPVTMKLGLITIVLSVIVGLTMGILASLRPNTWLDYVTSVAVVANIVTPTFVVAILLVYIFSISLAWLPTGGCCEPKQMIMPVFAYMLAPAAIIARYTRSAMLEVSQQDYVRTARAKGLPERSVVLRHSFKNALIPILTILGPLTASMVTGSFFIETIFRIPGIGNQLTFSIYNRDYPVIMALTLLWSAVIAFAYLFTDILYVTVDPRVRLGGGTE